jgi:hypothetical protein
MRISNLAVELTIMGETVEDSRVVKKFLRVIPSRFNPVVDSIEMFCDLEKMTMEELVGWLCVVEKWLDDKVEQIIDKAGRLMLAEDDWLEKHMHHFYQGPKDGGGSSGGGSSDDHGGYHKGKAVVWPNGNSSGQVKLTSEGTPRQKKRCRNCNIYGHWDQDCKRPKKEKKKAVKQQEANVAVGDRGRGGLLMLAECDVIDLDDRALQTVHLSEKITPIDVPDGVWVLDTGASNHMTGTRSALTQLDKAARHYLVWRWIMRRDQRAWLHGDERSTKWSQGTDRCLLYP